MEERRIVIVNTFLGIPGDSRRKTTIMAVDAPSVEDVVHWAKQVGYGFLESDSYLDGHQVLFFRGEDGSLTSVDYFDWEENEEWTGL